MKNYVWIVIGVVVVFVGLIVAYTLQPPVGASPTERPASTENTY